MQIWFFLYDKVSTDLRPLTPLLSPLNVRPERIRDTYRLDQKVSCTYLFIRTEISSFWKCSKFRIFHLNVQYYCANDQLASKMGLLSAVILIISLYYINIICYAVWIQCYFYLLTIDRCIPIKYLSHKLDTHLCGISCTQFEHAFGIIW